MAKHYWAIHVSLDTDDFCFSAGPHSWPPIELRAQVGRRLGRKGSPFFFFLSFCFASDGMMISGSGGGCVLLITITKRAGWLGCLFNQSQAEKCRYWCESCKESWSRVELGRHFILVTGVSAPQDQTSQSFASQRRHLSFKLSHFLRRLLLFYDNPSSYLTSTYILVIRFMEWTHSLGRVSYNCYRSLRKGLQAPFQWHD